MRTLAAPSAPRARREIVGVDLMRFVAAAMVMAFHLGYWQWAAPGTRTNSLVGLGVRFPELARVASNGWVGVEIFFVISGFVIAWSAQEASFAAFAQSRFLRLAPAAWICATLAALALLISGSANLHALLTLYLRTLTFFPTAPWIDDAYWTLDIEIAFYGLVALLIACGLRRRIVAVVGAISSAFWICEAFVRPGGGLAATIAWLAGSRYADLSLLHHGVFFCVGVLFYRVMDQARLSRAEIGLMGVCLLGGVIEIAASAAAKAQTTGYPHSLVAPTVVWLIALAGMAASIRFNARLAGWKASAHARTLGLVTYPLYLLHTVVGCLTIKTMTKLGISPWLGLCVAVVFVLLLAFLVSHYLEPALRRRLRRALSFTPTAVRARLDGGVA